MIAPAPSFLFLSRAEMAKLWEGLCCYNPKSGLQVAFPWPGMFRALQPGRAGVMCTLLVSCAAGPRCPGDSGAGNPAEGERVEAVHHSRTCSFFMLLPACCRRGAPFLLSLPSSSSDASL